MSRGFRPAAAIVVLVAAFVLQASYSPDMQIAAARPNFAICALLVASLFAGPNVGAIMGFCTGLMEAGAVGDFVGSLIVTRSLAGFTVGALDERIFRDNLFVAVFVVLIGTIFIHECFFLFAPQPHAIKYAIRVLSESLYNAALAIPIYYMLRRWLRNAAPAT